MKVKLFSNDNDKAKSIRDEIIQKLISNDFEVVDDDYELAIAVGGDGAFLRMIKETNFNSDALYVGVNAGTLGFAQEVSVEELDDFINELKNKEYKVDSIGVQETKVITQNAESKFYSLNEIVIREKELNTLSLDINVEDEFLEKLVGDGVLIATSFGSTAYNLSFGGSIIYNTFHTLQLTPIAPLNNKSYRNLLNSVVIPETKVITIEPSVDRNDLLITVDGENNAYENVRLIETFVDKKRIRCLRRKDYDFAKKINEKFLK